MTPRHMLVLLALVSGAAPALAQPQQSPPPKPSGGAPDMEPTAKVDHLILGIRSVEDGVREFAEKTGVTPVRGGRHPGGGTENALVSLGNGSYVEIIAVVPGENPGRWSRLLDMPRLTAAAWAIQTRDLAAAIDALKNAGLPGMGPMPGSRETPDGKLLNWRTGFVGGPGLENAPFLIEWGAGVVHPSVSSPGGCSLVSMSMAEPAAPRFNEYFKAVGLRFTADQAATPRLAFTLRCPKGEVTFTN